MGSAGKTITKLVNLPNIENLSGENKDISETGGLNYMKRSPSFVDTPRHGRHGSPSQLSVEPLLKNSPST